jgi:hypothetical protein
MWTIFSAVANVTPLVPLLLAGTFLCWGWQIARPRGPSRRGGPDARAVRSTTAPASDAAPSLALRRLAGIELAPRNTPPAPLEASPALEDSAVAGRAAGVPEALVHEALTAPVASADGAYPSMAQDPDVTVIDSIATMRARLQMTDLKNAPAARAN